MENSKENQLHVHLSIALINACVVLFATIKLFYFVYQRGERMEPSGQVTGRLLNTQGRLLSDTWE